MERELPIWWRPSIARGEIRRPEEKAASAAELLAEGVKYVGYWMLRRRKRSSWSRVPRTTTVVSVGPMCKQNPKIFLPLEYTSSEKSVPFSSEAEGHGQNALQNAPPCFP